MESINENERAVGGSLEVFSRTPGSLRINSKVWTDLKRLVEGFCCDRDCFGVVLLLTIEGPIMGLGDEA
jgi:hypothetical protein